KTINYKLKDWVFSRQRYWGEPIPLIHCEKCGVVAVPEKGLPVKLPKVKFYEPTDTGESPLAKIEKWVNVKCPKCGGKGKRETNTMPQWAGSSWYYLRYLDPKNKKAPVDKKKEKYWMNGGVDMYVGGAEHATRHLIYARFWHKFLYDIGIVGNKEPFASLKNQGMIGGNDGRRMSKRWGNVVNPDDVVNEYGADSFRLYEMFMGPFDQSIPWDTKNIIGVKRFLDRVWKMQEKITKRKENTELENLIHKTIKKISEDIENFHFNTAISALMILLNEMEKQENISTEHYSLLVVLISPLAPHMAEELWMSVLNNKKSAHLEKWPVFNKEKLQDKMFKLVVQIDGKVRDFFEVPLEISENDARVLTLKRENVKKWIGDKRVEKIIYVPKKIINIVTRT
ncbi:MAG: class I tRNA ligase family protein, partial [Patescibacteria group bacterium]